MNRSTQQSQRKKTYRRIGVVFVLCIILIVINPANFFGPLRSGIATIFAPAQKIFYAASYGARSFGALFGDIGELRADNERLRSDNEKLSAQNALLKDVQNENALLREQFHLALREQYDMQSAHVIARDGIHQGTWITIDRGSRDGIRDGMAAVVGEGILIGRVSETFPTTARITLVTHPDSTFSGVTTDTSARGIVRGAHGLTLRFNDVLQKEILTVGDAVVSEDINDTIPRGLLMGTIQDVAQSQDGLFQQATVTVPRDMSTIRFVSIIIKSS